MKGIKKIIAAALAMTSLVSVFTSCNSDNSVRRVKQSGILTVGYSSCSEKNDAPFVMEKDGITSGPAEEIAKDMKASASFVRLNSAELYDRLLSGDVDCLWNVASPEKQYVSSVRTIGTGIYYRQVIMTPADSDITKLSEVSGRTMAVVSGSDAQAALGEASVMKSSLSGIKLCGNIEEILEAFASGEADCAIVDEPQSLYTLYSTMNLDNFKFIDTPIAENQLVIAVRAEDAELCTKISEKYVKMVQDGDIKALCKKYTGGDMLVKALNEASSEV